MSHPLRRRFPSPTSAAESPGPRHTTVRILTEEPTQFIDITARVQEFAERSGVRCGLVHVQSLHTTVAVVVNEWEPLLIQDFAGQLERLAARDTRYAHDDFGRRHVDLGPLERANGHAHCRAWVLGAAVCLAVHDGRVRLGRWQRVLAVELDGPQARELALTMIGES
jgi:secondary thiamine-phosphate synthase enzyme